MFDSANRRVLRFRNLRCPSGATSTILLRRAVCARLIYALALLAQAAQPAAGAGELAAIPTSSASSPTPARCPKSFCSILLIFSAVSWGIILYKFWTFRRAERQTSTFLSVFRKSSKFSEVQAVCPTLTESPLVGLFQSGYAELNAQLRHRRAGRPGQAGGRPPDVLP